MKRTGIMMLCPAILLICSSCGMAADQRLEIAGKNLVVEEQVEKVEQEPKNTTESSRRATESYEQYEQRRKAEYDALLEKAVSNLPYNDVIKSTVSEDLLFDYLDHQMNPWSSDVPVLLRINDCYEIECIRAIDDKRMYSIQKPESGGLFYSFYKYGGLDCTAYITKTLCFSDYSSIKVGSSIDDVIAIEPATQAFVNRNKMWEDDWSGKFAQHIILKDGLLKLSYCRSGDTYEVNHIEFFEDFREPVDYDMDYLWVYDYSILPDDYPE